MYNEHFWLMDKTLFLSFQLYCKTIDFRLSGEKEKEKEKDPKKGIHLLYYSKFFIQYKKKEL